jgi:hypothetical protein
MKHITLFLALLLAVMIPLAGFSEYSDSEAFSIAKKEITKLLEDENCSDLRFAFIDYHVNSDGSLYAVYSDVKYNDGQGKNQRDYFSYMFTETSEGYQPCFFVLGTRFVIVPAEMPE